MAMANRNEGSKISSDINVTPMVDVMLVLLIIFMVVTPILVQPGAVPVNMAKTNHPLAMPDAQKEDALLVAITRDGMIYLGNDHVALDQLGTKLKDKLERRLDKHVFVKADAHAKYGAVVDVANNLRSASVEDIGLLTEQSKSVLPSPSPAGKKAELKT